MVVTLPIEAHNEVMFIIVGFADHPVSNFPRSRPLIFTGKSYAKQFSQSWRTCFLWSVVCGFRIPDFGFRISDSGFRFPVSGFRFRILVSDSQSWRTCFLWFVVSGFRIPDSGFQIPDSRFRIPDSGFQIPDYAFRFPVSDSGFRIPDSGFRIPDSGFRILGFRVARLKLFSEVMEHIKTI